MPYIANPLEGLPIRNSFITDQANLGTAAASDDTIIIYDISATALKQLTIANMQAGILVAPAFTGVPTAPTASQGTSTTQLATTAFVTIGNTALNTVAEMTDVTITSIASDEVLKWNGSAWINQTLAEANILPASGPTFTGVLTVGSAVISEADLEQIDDLTAGTAVASKALVVDSDKDIGTIRNLTIDGIFTDGNYSFDTSGNVSGLGTVASGAITSSGIIKTDSTTNATSTTDGSLQTDGGLSVALDVILGDDLTLISDAAVLNFGVNSDVSLTHVHNTGLLLNGTSQLQFNDSSQYISSTGTVMSIVATDEIDLTATAIDINGAVAFDGALSGVTTLAIGGTLTGVTDLTLSGTLSDGNYTFDTSGNVTGLGTISGTSLATSAAIPLLLTNGQLVNIALTSQSSGATTLTIPDFAGVADTFVFATLAQTLVGKTLTAPTINGVVGGTATSQTITTLTSTTVNAGTLVAAAASITDSSGAITFGDENLTTTGTLSAGVVTGTGFTIGSASMVETDLERVEDITPGTAAASKAVVLDGSKNIATIGTIGSGVITATGTSVFSGLDVNGSVDISGTLTMSGGTVDMSGEDLDNIRSATFIAEVDNGNSSTSDTIDWGAGQKQKSTLTGNCTYTFTAPDGPCNIMLKLIQDGTGSRTVTWPNTVKWAAATAPTLTTTASATDIIAFYYDGTNYYGQSSLAFG